MHPPYRSLDIYRLVVLRNLPQTDVANSFHVHPSRISQVVRQVREWVNDAIGDWLFPGRDDLRFQAALALEDIRLTEHECDPHVVTFEDPQSRYTRQNSASPPRNADNASPGANQALNLSAHPLNSSAQLANGPFATTSDPTDTSLTPAVAELATHIAQLLILWKKSRKISAAIRPIRRRSPQSA